MTPKQVYEALRRAIGFTVIECIGMEYHGWSCGGRHAARYLHPVAGGGAVLDTPDLGQITVFPLQDDPGLTKIAYYLATP